MCFFKQTALVPSVININKLIRIDCKSSTIGGRNNAYDYNYTLFFIAFSKNAELNGKRSNTKIISITQSNWAYHLVTFSLARPLDMNRLKSD